MFFIFFMFEFVYAVVRFVVVTYATTAIKQSYCPSIRSYIPKNFSPKVRMKSIASIITTPNQKIAVARVVLEPKLV